MQSTLLVHVVAGALGLLSGYVALYAAKGAPLHRKSGMLFVYVMTVMATTGLFVSAIEGIAPAINVPTALLTLYMVITSLTTVRPVAAGLRWAGTAQMWAAFAIALGCVALALNAIGKGGAEAGLAFPLFLFAGAAAIGGEGDRRLLRAGAVRGAPRLKRHLWRMCFGLFIASIAFYAGPNRLPEALRSPAFRAFGVVLPLLVMSYWLWRLRARRATRSMARVTVAEAA
jgi:uncharacterized membrane protein